MVGEADHFFSVEFACINLHLDRGEELVGKMYNLTTNL